MIIILKKKPAIELYKSAAILRKRIIDMDGKCTPLEDFKVVEYAEIVPPTSDEIKLSMLFHYIILLQIIVAIL